MTRGYIMQGNRFEFDDRTDAIPSDEPQPTPSGEDDRLLEAVRAYTAAKESGRAPNRAEFISRYPDIASDLSACLAGLAFVDAAAAEIPGSSRPAGGTPEHDAGADETQAGRPLGDFRLIREIGRGGMGVVYEAEQLSLGRRVAVKVLPMAASLDARHLQRFRNEAQAAAQLHHNNIVPVYAVGCERSVNFYAMQLIEGRSLSDVIRELRKAAGRDEPAGDDALAPVPDSRNGNLSSRAMDVADGAAPASGPGLSPSGASPASLSSLRSSKRSAYFRAVARLGLQAAEALDYAHRAGVVHRDVKPANLLLDTHGNLWITDFGLAQFYTQSNLTQTGDLVGTLRYMSPEQASGRAVVLDQRTDVYSLGVTLYELLTLERALPGETREQLLQQLGSYDPRPARSVDKAIPPELETILIKATAKDPADRYASAKALAEELMRFLQDEPILARPPSLWDKSVKWTRRHRTLALSAVAMLVLASVGLLASTLLIAREQRKTKSAYLSEQQRAIEANQQRVRAERSFNQARDAVNFLSRVAADELAGTPHSAEVRKEMLEAALDYYQGFLEDHQGDTAVGAELTDAQTYVGHILAELSAFEDFDRIDASAKLLLEPTVQSALKLSSDQIARAQTATAGFENLSFGDAGRPGVRLEPPPDFGNMTEEQKQQRYAASAASIESSLNALLTSRQMSRLRQITRQVRAPASFSDSDITDALALSREQKDAFRKAQASFRTAMRKTFARAHPRRRDGRGGFDDPDGPPDGPGRPEGRPAGPPPDSPDAAGDDVSAAQQSIRDDAVGQILASLGPAQRDTWKKLTGEPFDGLASIQFGPSGPGGPGHGPRRRHGEPDDGAFDHGGPPRDGIGPGGPDRDYRGPGDRRPGPGRDGADGPGGPDNFGPPPREPRERPGSGGPPPIDTDPATRGGP